ncbi:MAG: hypothetical protein ABEH58_07775 [Haloplanus sp.]
MSKATISDEQSADDYYLPGAAISTNPGPVERFLTRLFRRRGRF